MFRSVHRGRLAAIVLLAVAVLLTSPTVASAHSRYDHSEPASGSALDGSPFVLKAWFSQELTSKSHMQVFDVSGIQVDLGDGKVDLDDPIRKMMMVSLPELQPGVYTVRYTADSAEDGHMFEGAFAFGVGMEAPVGELTAEQAAPATP
ncbi:MAG: copper resistance protein CopC [Chloroflexota bacterium]